MNTMNTMNETRDTAATDALCRELAEVATSAGTHAMFERLAAALKDQRRWHAVFDARLLQARAALGLPLTGDPGPLDPATREKLDAASLDACREVGWPLLEEGRVSAGWMYLRAAAETEEVARRLAARADLLRAAAADGDAAEAEDGTSADDESLQEIIHIALWEGVDPALGLTILLERNGTCNAITAYEQGVSRLPAARQQPAAAVLIAHLHRELSAALAADLAGRAAAPGGSPTDAASIPALLAAAGGMADDPAIHLDVSHLQSVLRIARVCTDRDAIRKAWELACYGCRLPAEAVYPGEPPFENVAEASRLFFGAQLGVDAEQAVQFFRRAAATARLEESGTLPADTLTVLLTRLGRPAEALHSALARPHEESMPSSMQSSGMLPSLVELAAAGGAWETLRAACRERGDAVTFAATLAAEQTVR